MEGALKETLDKMYGWGEGERERGREEGRKGERGREREGLREEREWAY